MSENKRGSIQERSANELEKYKSLSGAVANYGLHNESIRVVNPVGYVTEGMNDEAPFYIGQRYLGDSQEFIFNENKEAEPTSNSGKRQLIEFGKNGTITDKRKNTPQETNFISTNVTNQGEEKYLSPQEDNNGKPFTTVKDSRTIDENKNAKLTEAGGKLTAELLYSDFNPSDHESGFYLGTYPTTRSDEDFYGSSKYIKVNIGRTALNKQVNKSGPIKKPEDNNYITGTRDFNGIKVDFKNAINNDQNKIGSTVWDGDNWDNSIRTNVDKQDDMLYDDIEKQNIGSIGTGIVNSIKNIPNEIGVIKDAKKIVSAKANDSYDPVNKSKHSDDTFILLQKAKNEKYKNIKLGSKLGTYNSLANLLGTASGMLVGSLGKSTLSNMFDDMTSKFTGGFGLAGILENLNGAVENLPTLEEIIALNLVTYYNMYDSRPGRLVYDRYHKFNFITGNTSSGIDGSKTGADSWRDVLQGVTNKITSTIGLGNNFISGNAVVSGINAIKDTAKDVMDSVSSGNLSDIGSTIKSGVQSVIKAVTKSPDEWLDEFSASNVISNERTKYEVEVANSGDGNSNKNEGNGNGQNTKINASIVSKANLRNMLTSSTAQSKIISGEFTKRFTEQINAEQKNMATTLLGEIYIEPFATENNELVPDSIPFQFNPTITDGGTEARYQIEELVGRILPIRSYISTDSASITLETKYFATSDGGTMADGGEGSYGQWLREWTPNALFQIEKKYRKLVLPYIKDTTYVRPPIVRLHIGYNKSTKVSKLFQYPGTTLGDCFEVTGTLEGITAEKRYIVTNMTINPIHQDGWDWYINYSQSSGGSELMQKLQDGKDILGDLANTTEESLGGLDINKIKEAANNGADTSKLRAAIEEHLGSLTANGGSGSWISYSRGFTVSLTLVETTKNFLDTLPNYWHYDTPSSDILDALKSDPVFNNLVLGAKDTNGDAMWQIAEPLIESFHLDTSFLSLGTNIKEQLTEKLKGTPLVSAIGDKVNAAKEKTQQAINAAKEKAQQAVNKAKEKVQETVNKAKEKIVNSKAGQAVKNAVNKVTSSKAGRAIKKAVSSFKLW